MGRRDKSQYTVNAPDARGVAIGDFNTVNNFTVRHLGSLWIGIAFGLVLAVAVSLALLRGLPWTGPPQPTCADVGNKARGKEDSQLHALFVNTYARNGGSALLGCPRADDQSGYVHRWGPGSTQDFEGGSLGPARIMALDTQAAIVVAGDYWADYISVYGRDTAPMAGYPVGDPVPCGTSKMVSLLGGTNSPSGMVTAADSEHFIWLPPKIWARYQELGGPLGRLGRPKRQRPGAAFTHKQDFEHGYIRINAGRAVTEREDQGRPEPTPAAGRRAKSFSLVRGLGSGVTGSGVGRCWGRVGLRCGDFV